MEIWDPEQGGEHVLLGQVIGALGKKGGYAARGKVLLMSTGMGTDPSAPVRDLIIAVCEPDEEDEAEKEVRARFPELQVIEFFDTRGVNQAIRKLVEAQGEK